MDRPSRTKLHPVGSLSSSQPGGPSCWVSPLAFGLNRFYLRSASSRCPISEVFGEKYELKPKFNPKMAHFESFSSERFFERSIVYVCMDAFPPKNLAYNKIGLPPGFFKCLKSFMYFKKVF